ncbi:MAG TPA: ATP-dependent DNA helicase RecG [Gammaproteobacteria bacterium]|nr:ATP-dependent DNA helicase RecG [Gammaproteobacteria bacterium]
MKIASQFKTSTLPSDKTGKALSQLPCSSLRGVGPQLTAHLEKLGIHTIQDLLFHLPLRYQDRTRIIALKDLHPGDHVVVQGTIKDTQLRQGRRRSLLCQITDHTGTITLRFFHFNKSQLDAFARNGAHIRCFGEIRWGMAGYEMVHPEYRFINPDEPLAVEDNLTPIYPTTEGLQQASFRKLTDQALALLKQCQGLDEYLPETLLQRFKFSDLTTAIMYVHRPPREASRAQLASGQHPAQQRLAFEELLAHQLSRRWLKQNFQQKKAPSLSETQALITPFLQQLPFKLTKAQLRVAGEVQKDLLDEKPMLRLIQGDVGAGKTVVAALAILQAVASGFQAAFMAPTELLAEQHHKNFKKWLTPLNLNVVFLASRLTTQERKQALSSIENGQAQIVVGTHALFQKEVKFARLGLVVIDEQHRFGVEQRLELAEKGRQNDLVPHQLIMTATPIPRTLAMTAYADLDYSVIDELPPGRKPITTAVISSLRREEVMQHIDTACRQGRQAYWVCTLIEESEVLQCQAAEATATFLTQSLPGLRLALIHGRLKSTEKEQIMLAFRNGDIDLLVATTVIEVGVDVPNASLMVIENPERLGLAQLHQLRGRVGRGNESSYCILLYQYPLSQFAKQRLQVIKDSQDGFVIASKDLELRGPGEVLGTRQTGLLQLRIADLLRDKALLPDVEQASLLLLQHYPEQVGLLIARWIAAGGKYSAV